MLQILGLLGGRPEQEWTLAAISQRLHITGSTALAILNELRKAGFVVRAPDKTYTLGPALLSLGRAADERFPMIRAIAGELTPFVSELGCGGSVSFIDGADLVSAYRFGQQSYFLRRDVVTIRIPFGFPYGACYVAWGETGSEAKWLARSGLTKPQRSWMKRVLADIRRCGYEVLGPDTILLDYLGAETDIGVFNDVARTQNPAIGGLRTLLSERNWSTWFLRTLKAEEHYSIGLITAPIFDAHQRPRFLVSLHFNGEELNGGQTIKTATAFCAEARRISKLLVGAVPS